MIALVMTELFGGAICGGLVGVAGALGSAWVQRRARMHRNEVVTRRGEPAVKDVVWVPPWRGFGIVGALLGAVVAPLSHSVWAAAAAGLVLPGLLVGASGWIALGCHWPRR
jgi:hypothetical protein